MPTSSINYITAFADNFKQSDPFLKVNNNVLHINELFKLFSNNVFCEEIIAIDIEKFISCEGSDVVSFMDSLNTVINCTCDIICRPKLVVAVDICSNPNLIKLLLGSKIHGFYPRGDAFTHAEKLDCINKVSNGEFYIHPKIKELISCKKVIPLNTIELTPRQEQIVSLIQCRGASNKVIAKMLNITESTVKLHISHIFKKCGVKNRTQLAVFLKK